MGVGRRRPRRAALTAACALALLGAGSASAAPPGNDAFAAATLLRAATGSYNGTNREATKQTGEPRHAGNVGGASVWYRWVAPAAGTATFDTLAGGFDTLLAVYTGSSVGALTLVAQNDNATSATRTSKVSFSARAATTYYVAVDGYNGGSVPARGTFAVNWQLTATGRTVPNDRFAAATAIDGPSGTSGGTSLAATKESGEPSHAANAGGASVWLRWTAPATAQVTFSTDGSAFDTLLGIYTGVAVGSLVKVAESDDIAWNILRSSVTFGAQQGTTYSIAVDGKRFSYSGAASGDYTLTWRSAALTPPVNDAFASAVRLTGVGGVSRRTTAGATKEPGEPDHAGNPGGASVWYTWTAPADGVWRFYTAGSTFNTLLAAYSGASVDALSPVAANDDASATDTTSSVAFFAREGRQYSIAVDGVRGASGPPAGGSFNLNWELRGPDPDLLPVNDDFRNAWLLPGASGHATGTNVGFTKETGEPAHAGNAGAGSAWYAWTASASGPAFFDTPGSSFDTLLGVYTGSAVGALEEVAANDDIAYNHWWPNTRLRESYVGFHATEGVTYYIAVDGKNGARGSIYLGWWLAREPPDATLLAAGDIGRCDSTNDEATGALLGQYPSATVAALGDIAYENGTTAELGCFDRAWGAAKARIRPVPGDHDYGTAGAAPYFSYFGAAAGAPGSGYYSYELGAWHVVALNTNCDQIGGCGVGSPQERWLRADLRAHRSQCTLAYSADPLFASAGGGNAAIKPLWQALYDNGTDVVVAGDSHYYERFAPQTPSGVADPNGIREFIAGTGGGTLFGTPLSRAANSEFVQTGTYGVMRLTLHADGYGWTFLPVAGSTFTDSGIGECS